MIYASSACGTSDVEVDAPEARGDELRALRSSEILGTIAYGETKGPIAYTEIPLYRAFRFSGRARDRVRITVYGDNVPQAWLLSSGFATLKSATATGFAHTLTFEETLTATAAYYIAFHEQDQEDAHFYVKLQTVSASDAGTSDAGDGGSASHADAGSSDAGDAGAPSRPTAPGPVRKWTFSTGNAVRTPPVVAADGTIFVSDVFGALAALDPNTAAPKWSRSSSGSNMQLGLGPRGELYATASNVSRGLYRLDPRTGATLWEDAFYVFASKPVIRDDGVLFVQKSSYLTALGSDDSFRWATVSDPVYTTPAFSRSRTVYAAGTSLDAHDADTGTTLWSFSTPKLVGAPVVGDDGTIYANDVDGLVYAVNPDGTARWTKSTGSSSSGGEITTRVFGGTVYVTNRTTGLTALDAATGATKWTASPSATHWGPPASSSGTLYVSGEDGRLYALRASDGTTKWSMPAGRYVMADPVIGADGSVLVGTDSGLASFIERDPSVPTTTPCSNGAVEEIACGACGHQSRVCLVDATGKDVWQPWGACTSELVGGCYPGDVRTTACGRCGAEQDTCQVDCRWSQGSCLGEPANACVAGALDYQEGLSCLAGGRARSCSAACQWGSYGACVVPPASVSLTLAPHQDSVFRTVTISTAQMGHALTGSSCPAASIGVVPYAFVRLVNPSDSTVWVSVWTGKDFDRDPDLDTVIAQYDSAIPPPLSSVAACTRINDHCTDFSSLTACNRDWGGIMMRSPASPIRIPAGGGATVYVAASIPGSSATFRVYARTEVELHN